jgi:hypothetical protein
MVGARAGAFYCAPDGFANGLNISDIFLNHGIGWERLYRVAFDAVA